MMRKKIRVLIVDDSMVYREIISKGISSDIEIEVVATANDPFDASEKIVKYQPDVMTCDIEMPKMNGIEFIQRLMPQYPLPVIVISSVNRAVFDAIKAGAVDFVAKPDVNVIRDIEDFINEMIIKIKIAASSRVLHSETEIYSTKINDDSIRQTNRIIAIGASTGGTEAIYHLLKGLPRNIPGIVIVQHIPPNFSRMFAERLNTSTNLEVKEAESGDYVETGRVLIAPGDKHMAIKKIGSKYKVESFQGEKVNGHCPSVDILFESVAKEANSNAIGVILTGMGYDGAKGLLSMKRRGASTIGQDEKTSVVYGMPKVAFNIGAVDKQMPLDDIPKLILSMLR
jgi:two-component system chemotaxis response regulator CheB